MALRLSPGKDVVPTSRNTASPTPSVRSGSRGMGATAGDGQPGAPPGGGGQGQTRPRGMVAERPLDRDDGPRAAGLLAPDSDRHLRHPRGGAVVLSVGASDLDRGNTTTVDPGPGGVRPTALDGPPEMSVL